MKRTISLFLLLIVLSACNQKEAKTNYYVSLSGESEHWKLDGYEMMITPEDYKAGNGNLIMKHADDEHMMDFLSFDAYAVVDGEETRFHGNTVSGDVDITEQSTGTIDGEEATLKDFQTIDKIYVNITWHDNDTNGDKEERIVLYDKYENEETFLK